MWSSKCKSQQQLRKLKKLEEKRENSKLLHKSFQTLLKHTITPDSHSFLIPCQNVGQAETRREKRRMSMLFSKAGLQLPENERRPKRLRLNDDGEGEGEEEVDLAIAAADDAADSINVHEEVIDDCEIDLAEDYTANDASGGGSCEAETCTLVEETATEDSCHGVQLNAMYSASVLPFPLDYDDAIQKTVKESLEDSQVDKRCFVGDSLQLPLETPTVIVPVSRPKEIENGRRDLPIIMMEQEIVEAVDKNSSVIICGETGCGKTTQIPQFLYEAGYGSPICSMKTGAIAVTQPRRVAVLSTARRVAYELGLSVGKEVGYQVRFEKRVGENCSIKFMTDGILLRELQSDDLLRRYSVVVLDEVHERSVNTDILIGLLLNVIQKRQKKYKQQAEKEVGSESRVYPLKLILMSATLRIQDFTSERIFPEPPFVIEIPTRQFPVTRHFSRKTEISDYIGEAYKVVLKIHRRLPSGGILVFVTGQREVEYLCGELRRASKRFTKQRFPSAIQNETTMQTDIGQIDWQKMKRDDEALDTGLDSSEQPSDRFSSDDEYQDYSNSEGFYSSLSESEWDIKDIDQNQKTFQLDGNVVDVLGQDAELNSLKAAFDTLVANAASTSLSSGEQMVNAESKVCSNKCKANSEEENGGKESPGFGPLRVLPLYGMLPSSAQLRVFEQVKEGERLVVVATNVAETSLTIPGIKYVVDTGREKVKTYNPSNGMESYAIQWISKASAAQRAGRAGRIGPGHCYCLYSSAAVTNVFEEFSCPEILKVPVEGVVLLLKSMKCSKIAELPIPTLPDSGKLVEAEECLKALAALNNEGEVTPVGRTMSQFPISPRNSRLLLCATQILNKMGRNRVQGELVLGYAAAVSAALSLSTPFLSRFDASESSSAMGMELGNQDQQAKLTRKQMEESKPYRVDLSNLKSDAIALSYALQCYEQFKDASQSHSQQKKKASRFCSGNALHLETMEKMSKLRKQLLRLVFSQRINNGLHKWTYETVEHRWKTISCDKFPLSNTEDDVLCEAICAGWVDRVAKRVKGAKVSANRHGKLHAAARYEALKVAEPVFLHRSTSVCEMAPDFIVYHEMMLHSKRVYIHAATSVKPEWLVKYGGSLCSYSNPLNDPKPYYDPVSDQALCYVIPELRPREWRLPVTKIPVEDVQQRVSLFAYSLLSGQVLPCLKVVCKFLVDSPSCILEPNSFFRNRRVYNLLTKLRSRTRIIDSCGKLRDEWNENPDYLQREILEWFDGLDGSLFEKLWVIMHKETLLAPDRRFVERTSAR